MNKRCASLIRKNRPHCNLNQTATLHFTIQYLSELEIFHQISFHFIFTTTISKYSNPELWGQISRFVHYCSSVTLDEVKAFGRVCLSVNCYHLLQICPQQAGASSKSSSSIIFFRNNVFYKSIPNDLLLPGSLFHHTSSFTPIIPLLQFKQ